MADPISTSAIELSKQIQPGAAYEIPGWLISIGLLGGAALWQIVLVIIGAIGKILLRNNSGRNSNGVSSPDRRAVTLEVCSECRRATAATIEGIDHRLDRIEAQIDRLSGQALQQSTNVSQIGRRGNG